MNNQVLATLSSPQLFSQSPSFLLVKFKASLMTK